MKVTKNVNVGDEELVIRTITTTPRERFDGKWKPGRLYPLFSVVENNGTTFVSQNAKMKEEPYVIYDSATGKFSAPDGWKIKEMSADSRLTAMGGGGGGGVTPEDVAGMIAGKQDAIADLPAIRSGAAAGATAYQKPNAGIPKTDLASAVQASLAKADSAVQDISGKQDTLVSGTNIKTINGQSVLGSGDITIQPGDTDAVKYTQQTLTDAQKGQARDNIGAVSGADLSTKQDTISDLSTIRSGAAAGATAYQKPSGGIPASDMASGAIPTDAIKYSPQNLTEEQKEQARQNIGAGSFSGNPVIGFSTPTTPDGTIIAEKANGDTETIDLNHNHPQYYSKVVETAIPSGGLLPDVVYSLGTLTGTVAFSLAAAVTGNVNHYFWTFDTGSTAPTVTWPSSNFAWADGTGPTIAASKHYEISVLGGIATFLEV